MCVCVCVCVCERERERERERESACVRASERACLPLYVCVCVRVTVWSHRFDILSVLADLQSVTNFLTHLLISLCFFSWLSVKKTKKAANLKLYYCNCKGC